MRHQVLLFVLSCLYETSCIFVVLKLGTFFNRKVDSYNSHSNPLTLSSIPCKISILITLTTIAIRVRLDWRSTRIASLNGTRNSPFQDSNYTHYITYRHIAWVDELLHNEIPFAS